MIQIKDYSYTKFTSNYTVMPADCNYMGVIFGGHAMAQLDLCAASLCRRLLQTIPDNKLEAVTHKVTGITFHCAPKAGDIVYMNAFLKSMGKNSFVVEVIAYVERKKDGLNEAFADSGFVFVTRNPETGTYDPHNLKYEI